MEINKLPEYLFGKQADNKELKERLNVLVQEELSGADFEETNEVLRLVLSNAVYDTDLIYEKVESAVEALITVLEEKNTEKVSLLDSEIIAAMQKLQEVASTYDVIDEYQDTDLLSFSLFHNGVNRIPKLTINNINECYRLINDADLQNIYFTKGSLSRINIPEVKGTTDGRDCKKEFYQAGSSQQTFSSNEGKLYGKQIGERQILISKIPYTNVKKHNFYAVTSRHTEDEYQYDLAKKAYLHYEKSMLSDFYSQISKINVDKDGREYFNGFDINWYSEDNIHALRIVVEDCISELLPGEEIYDASTLPESVESMKERIKNFENKLDKEIVRVIKDITLLGADKQAQKYFDGELDLDAISLRNIDKMTAKMLFHRQSYFADNEYNLPESEDYELLIENMVESTIEQMNKHMPKTKELLRRWGTELIYTSRNFLNIDQSVLLSGPINNYIDLILKNVFYKLSIFYKLEDEERVYLDDLSKEKSTKFSESMGNSSQNLLTQLKKDLQIAVMTAIAEKDFKKIGKIFQRSALRSKKSYEFGVNTIKRFSIPNSNEIADLDGWEGYIIIPNMNIFPNKHYTTEECDNQRDFFYYNTKTEKIITGGDYLTAPKYSADEGLYYVDAISFNAVKKEALEPIVEKFLEESDFGNLIRESLFDTLKDLYGKILKSYCVQQFSLKKGKEPGKIIDIDDELFFYSKGGEELRELLLELRDLDPEKAAIFEDEQSYSQGELLQKKIDFIFEIILSGYDTRAWDKIDAQHLLPIIDKMITSLKQKDDLAKEILVSEFKDCVDYLGFVDKLTVDRERKYFK